MKLLECPISPLRYTIPSDMVIFRKYEPLDKVYPSTRLPSNCMKSFSGHDILGNEGGDMRATQMFTSVTFRHRHVHSSLSVSTTNKHHHNFIKTTSDSDLLPSLQVVLRLSYVCQPKHPSIPATCAWARLHVTRDLQRRTAVIKILPTAKESSHNLHGMTNATQLHSSTPIVALRARDPSGWHLCPLSRTFMTACLARDAELACLAGQTMLPWELLTSTLRLQASLQAVSSFSLKSVAQCAVHLSKTSPFVKLSSKHLSRTCAMFLTPLCLVTRVRLLLESSHAPGFLLNTSTATAASLHSLIGNISMTSGSVNFDTPGSTSQEGKVCNTEVLCDPLCSPVYDYKTYVQSSNHASHHQIETAADPYKEDVNEPLPPRSTGLPPRTDISSRIIGTANASPKPARADQTGQHHRCCIGVLSAFEANLLNDEDKQAILEGGCHGLCSVQVTSTNDNSSNEGPSRASSLKSSPPARGPSDRPARFISPIPSDIIPNGRRGEGYTLPRFSRRRVAAEYKRPRPSLALVEHPSRTAGRPRGVPLAKHSSLEQTDRTSLRYAKRDSKTHTLANHRFNDLSSGSLDHLSSINYQPKQKLKRQVKHDDLRHEFENHGQLAEEAHLTLEAKEARITVQAKEKSSWSRKLLRKNKILFSRLLVQAPALDCGRLVSDSLYSIIDANEALNGFKYDKTGSSTVPLAIVVACVVQQPPYKVEAAATSGRCTEHKLRRQKGYANLRADGAV
ncbi:hypothetical protein KCU96_g70, partial [Aureobasidium melanogenum]